MTDLLMSFVVAPAVFLGLCAGSGMLVATILRQRRWGPMLAPVGLGVVVLVGTATTWRPATVPYATAIVVGVAAIGVVAWLVDGNASRPRDWWPAATAGAAFASFAAPVAASGQATWAGWVKLDDTATWLAFTDRLMESGKTHPVDVISTFDRVIDVNFNSAYNTSGVSYPTGAFPPLGVLSQITQSDVAWLIYPFMCSLGALLALALYAMLGTHITRRWARAGAAVVSAQATTLVAYVLWGGLKEILLTALLAALAVAAGWLASARASRLLVVPPILLAGALLTVTGPSGAGYLVPVLGLAILAGWYSRWPRSGAAAASAVLGGGLMLAMLTVAGLGPSQLSTPASTQGDIGNLLGALNGWQAVGIWPTEDFRLDPVAPLLTAMLILIATALACLGVVEAVRRRAWALPLFVLPALLVALYAQQTGELWLAAKALAVASPSVIVGAFAGSAAAYGWVRRDEPDTDVSTFLRGLAATGAVLVAFGVLWSNGLGYHGVWLAPKDELGELADIGEEFAGQGPALMTEYSPFGARHFLRTLDAESASELRVNGIPMRDGSKLDKGQSIDVGAFAPSTIDAYPILVLRRSPYATRPPANYTLVRPGRYFDTWRRDPDRGSVVADAPDLQGGPSAAFCQAITDLAAGAAADDVLVGAMAVPSVTVPLDAGPLPDGWFATRNGAVAPVSDGSVSARFTVDHRGDYTLWAAGSYAGRLDVEIDGARVFDGHSVIHADPALVHPLSSVTLEPGEHEVTARYWQPPVLPGSGAGPFSLGPLIVSETSGADTTLVEVGPGEAGRLCSLPLQWAEVLRPAP